jgi:hypothetical protein
VKKRTFKEHHRAPDGTRRRAQRFHCSSVVQPDETCRFMGLAHITANTGEYEIPEVEGDRIKSAVRLFHGATLRLRSGENRGYARWGAKWGM